MRGRRASTSGRRSDRLEWHPWRRGCRSWGLRPWDGCRSRTVRCLRPRSAATASRSCGPTSASASTWAVIASRRGGTPSTSTPTRCSAPTRRNSSTTTSSTSTSSTEIRNCFDPCWRSTAPESYTIPSRCDLFTITFFSGAQLIKNSLYQPHNAIQQTSSQWLLIKSLSTLLNVNLSSPWRKVCPSVCLSVTHRYSVDTAEHILKIFYHHIATSS